MTAPWWRRCASSLRNQVDPAAIRHQQPALALGLISERHLRNVIERLGSELFMPLDCDLAAVVYDPPAPGVPHMAVLFDAYGEVIAVRPVESIGAGEEALVSLVE